MKAACQTRYGSPEVVEVRDVDKPAPKDNEVLVKIYATTVNRTDCAYRAARPFIIRFVSGLRRPRVPVLGTEFAGVVEAAGPAVTSFSVGDRVFGYCEGSFGAHAEYMRMRADRMIAHIPASLTFEEVAPSLEGSHYALKDIRSAGVSAGHDVLVNGATGAIGSAAVQILKSIGADVTAVCGTEHVGLVKSLGADRVIDYKTTDFTQDSHTYDVVLDTVGKSTFGHCRRLLKPGGVYVSSELGPMAQNPFLALVTPLLRGKKVKFPIPTESRESVDYIGDLIESGQFKPVIDRTYPLDDIVEAHRYVETGQKIGNVVITVMPPA